MRRTIASRAGVGLLVLSLTLGAAVSAGADYTYFDDFSGDDAMTDSYWHSPFVEEVPPVHLEGLLSYIDGINERALGFYGGFEVSSEAYLGYAFPVAGPAPGIASGALSFEVPIAWHRPPQGLMFVTVSYEGVGGGFTETFTQSGVYELEIVPPAPCERVYVHFVGDGMALDDLSVTLMSVTPTERETWGAIKALYR
jgi:hypothetical protein